MFRVLTALANDQLDDCWEDNGRLMRFTTRQAAEEAITAHLEDCKEAYELGNMTEVPERSDFKIEECK